MECRVSAPVMGREGTERGGFLKPGEFTEVRGPRSGGSSLDSLWQSSASEVQVR